jgi:hypothetical protein
MIWASAAYFTVAALVFFALLQLEPLDGRAWLTVFLAALFWPVSLIIVAIPD